MNMVATLIDVVPMILREIPQEFPIWNLPGLALS